MIDLAEACRQAGRSEAQATLSVQEERALRPDQAARWAACLHEAGHVGVASAVLAARALTRSYVLRLESAEFMLSGLGGCQPDTLDAVQHLARVIESRIAAEKALKACLQ